MGGHRSARDAAAGLKPHIGQLARRRLGDPTYATRGELRFRRKGSFVVDLDKGIWCDHDPPGADGAKGGDALDLLAHLDGLTMREALAEANRFLGHAPAVDTPSRRPNPRSKKERIDAALKLWAEGREIYGTIGETYLRIRGISCRRLPVDLRFHPSCWHSESQKKYPAMLALFRDIASDEAVGVQVTYLRSGGLGKASVAPNRRTHGCMSGAAIKLTPDSDVTLGLGIAEGCETALSLLSVGWHAIWAVGSENAIAAFPILEGIEALTIFADHDEDGGHGIEKARGCARRWAAAEREVRIVYPRVPGEDWNGVLRSA